MKLWIDAAAPSPERVFGMSLIERHLKAARHQKLELSEVIVDVGAKAAEPNFVLEPRLQAPVRILQNVGSCGARLQAVLAAGEAVIVTDAGSLIDARLYGHLGRAAGSRVAREPEPQDEGIIARVEASDRDRIVTGAATLKAATADLPTLTQGDFPAFIRKLRRSTPYYSFRVADVTAARRIERFLFWSNYKGSTDFFTKYIYPPLVWLLVPPLARARVHPNAVTIVSILLTVLAVPLFAIGHFLGGFLCAYGMSVLDSVDGKLARLTFTDSWLGNVLDHGLDLVHPPFWYLAWAWGLTDGDLASPAWHAGLWMLALYVLDRLILAIYPRRYHRGLHTHAPIDGLVRTFISRRNINLPLFTVGYYLGLGIPTLYLIVAWQALTCLYHGGRTFWIFFIERAVPQSPA